jgi:hypothetical protein
MTTQIKLPRPAYFRSKNTVVNLDLAAAELSSIHFSTQIDVDRLSFYHVEHFDTEDRRLSFVLSGFLYLGELNGSEEKLRPGQEVRFDDLRGRIATIQLNPESLTLQFSGVVGKMETGSYQNPRDLMPAWLEWLKARHGLSLLWGTFLYLFGLTAAALRWFRGTHDAV